MFFDLFEQGGHWNQNVLALNGRCLPAFLGLTGRQRQISLPAKLVRPPGASLGFGISI